MSEVNRVWRLRQRPTGPITPDILSYDEEALPTPKQGEFLVRLEFLSLDPTNAIWMRDVKQYMPPVNIDDPMRGVVCGIVIETQSAEFPVGTRVAGIGTWAKYQLGSKHTMRIMADIPGILPANAFSTFAVVGPTAYFGLLEIGRPVAGETVVVSAAAGAVGSIVGQIAKIKGCRVVGLAGTDEKCDWLLTLGFDVAINYRTANINLALQAACPKGIDVYFDNVGGTILDACLGLMNLNGRIPTCGLISQYNAVTPVPGPQNYNMMLIQRLRIEGFIVLDFAHRQDEAVIALAQWMMEGRIHVRTEIIDGLENALTTLNKLFSGDHTGKLIVRV